MEAQDAGKIMFGVAILVLIVTVLVAFGAMFMVAFTGSLQSTSADTAASTQFTGTAATAYQLSAPISAISFFGSHARTYVIDNTVTLINTSSRTVTLAIDSQAANNGVAWSNINISINSTSNASSNASWLIGTCNGVNKSLSTLGTDTWTAINSSCLTPGGNLVLTFANKTTAGETVNVTGVMVSYFRYVSSAAYTSNAAAGTITPTASGYYKVTYTYGAGGIDYTNAKTALNTGITTITGIPSWLAIIVLIFILLIVFVLLAAIALVARGMMGGGQQ